MNTSPQSQAVPAVAGKAEPRSSNPNDTIATQAQPVCQTPPTPLVGMSEDELTRHIEDLGGQMLAAHARWVANPEDTQAHAEAVQWWLLELDVIRAREALVGERRHAEFERRHEERKMDAGLDYFQTMGRLHALQRQGRAG